MRFTSSLAALSLAMSASAKVHGEGDEGTIMGPVAFLWPDDRPWSAAYDNAGPCGSSSSVTNRSEFPLTQGEVALSIADDAYKVAFYISFDNNPTSESEFTEQIVSNVTEIEPGHQCYKIDTLPSSIAAGSNATIQLEYWADYEDENNGKNETFYACADIFDTRARLADRPRPFDKTFVEAADFTTEVPCFNVTAAEFDSGDATATTTVASATVTSTSSASSSGSSGLSKGAIAGVAVGTIVGSLAVVGALAFLLLKKRKSSAAAAALPTQQSQMKQRDGDAASVATTH